MSIYKKITALIAKIAEVICMVTISVLVLVIVIELLRRNFLNQSYRGTIEVCGISFLWMAFIGIIPLYQDSGLMRLDFLVAKMKGIPYEICYFANKAASMLLGVVMVIAFFAQYPFVSTRFYSTFSTPIPYTVQYVPMAIAGAFIALKTVEQVIEHIMDLCHKDTVGGTEK